MERLEALARHSDDPANMTRLYLGPAYQSALATVGAWMQEAGLDIRIDEACNLIGRREGTQPGLPALLLGSHLDTVRNAGKYDGLLGIVAAIEVVERLKNVAFPFAIEVAAWGNEEGVRFPTALTGVRAFAGSLDASVLDLVDEDGASMRQALLACGGMPEQLAKAARKAADYLAYLEVHIEQGPVLEAENLPLGIVTAIAGAERYNLEVCGVAGHAGTVPMALRHDALTATAEMVLCAEQIARATPDLLATVGQMAALPGAVNVIPAGARFSLDLRSSSDVVRQSARSQILAAWQAIATKRGVALTVQRSYENPATPCAAALMDQWANALGRVGVPVRTLLSGAGHDGQALASFCPMGMLFVRCLGGISHNPAESITEDDASLAVCVLSDVILHFIPPNISSPVS